MLMIQRWQNLLGAPAARRSLLLLVFCAVAAIPLGFVLVRPAIAERFIVHGGYYFILTVFALWVFYGWRLADLRNSRWLERLRDSWQIGLFLITASAFAIWTDSFAHKVLFDEYVLQGTAWHMHLTKEIGTPLRAYDFAGTWLVIDTFLDKRPYFFTFLISLLHDLAGFRLENVFVLNAVLAFAALTTTFWIVRTLTTRVAPALFAVALLATLPLFGQNATGASMELLNVTMIALLIVAAVLYLQRPDADRLAFLVLGAVLLAQTRYESVLFVLPVAIVVLLGWARVGKVILPWPAVIAPLLLVPYAWHDRFVTSKPILWQLREGEQTRFAWHYLTGNLEGARNFFFSVSPVQPNSLWLVLVGLAGTLCACLRFAKKWRPFADGSSSLPPAIPAVALFGATIAANLGMLMFYYWSRLDEPIASRFALPMLLIFSLTAGWFVHWLDARRIKATRWASFGLLSWLLVFAAPAYAHRFYTTQNLVMHELDWELEQAASRRGPILLITAKATLPFLLEKIPALNTSIAAVRGPQIAWHMRQGTFREVIVSQVLRPTSEKGEMIVDPDEELPANFRLETLMEKRFGARWIRLSRLVEVESAVATIPTAD